MFYFRMSSIYTVSVVIAAMRGNRLEYSTNICGASATLENAKILAKSLADNDEDIVRIFISRNRLDQKWNIDQEDEDTIIVR
jgi:hypothetical protein